MVALPAGAGQPARRGGAATRCSPRRWSGSRWTGWSCSPPRRGPAAAIRGGCSASPSGRLDELRADDRAQLPAFAQWFAAERAAAARSGVEELIDRALERDRLRPRGAGDAGRPAAAGQRPQADAPGARARGQRRPRPARVSRARAAGGPARAGVGDPRESEAPVEGEALDAVRLMTIHRAKGLEFESCASPTWGAARGGAPLMRVGRDGRFGLRLARARDRAARVRARLQGARRRAAAGRGGARSAGCSTWR